jgi:hypothetical protein
MSSVVLSQSVAFVLSQIEAALEVWFEKKFVIIDSTMSGGPVTEVEDKGRKQQKRDVVVKARFREKNGNKVFEIECHLTVKHFYKEWWFIEDKPVSFMINGKERIVRWEEPVGSTFDMITITVSNPKTGVSWTGYAFSERWPTRKA